MMPLAKIKAVTFDVGHTLIEPNLPVGEYYAEVAARHGHANLSAVELQRRFLSALPPQGGAVNTYADWARIVDETFAGLVAPPPSETFFPELFERFAQPSAWRIFDDVRPALDELARRGLRLGVITNWDNRLRPMLAGLNLAARFEVMVVSCELNTAKPAREMFERAASLFKLEPAEILHVGDSLEADVAGARAAGFVATQIARTELDAVGRISSLRRLLSLVDSGAG